MSDNAKTTIEVDLAEITTLRVALLTHESGFSRRRPGLLDKLKNAHEALFAAARNGGPE